MNKALIMAAGTGRRTNLAINKLLFKVGGETILEHTVKIFAAHASIDEIILVANAADMDAVSVIAEKYSAKVIAGGDTRTASVLKGLSCAGACDIIIIHDGARPNVSADIIDRSIVSAINYGSGVAAVPAVDSIRVAGSGGTKTVDRSSVYHVQTPQSFRYDALMKAYADVRGVFCDDSEVYEKKYGSVNLTESSYNNYKITTYDDIERYVNKNIVVGNGYDIHRLTTGRKLILGGIEILHIKGLMGHSDADVLLHAIMDALLSGAGERDIGTFFPDTSILYKDVDSSVLLKKVVDIINKKGYSVMNISAVLIAEKPKLSPYIELIRKNISTLLNIPFDRCGLTVTTSEKIGLIGRESGIASYAVAHLSTIL